VIEKRYTTKEAATIHQVSRHAVKRAILTGKLPAIKESTPRGAFYYILQSDLDRYKPRGGHGRPSRQQPRKKRVKIVVKYLDNG